MAQQRLRDYQSPLGSFLHNLINLGVHKPGRFSGFDTLKQTGVLQFSITHEKSGINTRDSADVPYGPLGVLMSNQGEILIEDAPLTALSINDNSDNPVQRTDYLVLSHAYFPVTPSTPGTYAILQGPKNSAPGGVGTPPVLNTYQTLIGVITIPAGANSIGLCTYAKAISPDSGDAPDAHLTSPNLFQTTNVQGAVDMSASSVGLVGVDSGLWVWDLPNTGNTFIFLQPNQLTIDCIRVLGVHNQDGFEINLVLGPQTKIRSFNNQGNTATLPAPYPSLGYKPIVFSDRIKNSIEYDGPQYCPGFTPQGATALVCVNLVIVNGVWVVKAIDGVGYKPARIGNKGEVMEIHMLLADIPNYFEPQQGTGINEYFGWQLCNGYNSWDKRGRVGIMSLNGIPGNGPVDGKISGVFAPQMTGGESLHTLTQPELPNVQLKLLSYRGGGEVYVHDTGGGGSNISIKNDADNNPNNPGPVLTTPLGSGNGHNIMQPYMCVLYAVWVGA